MNEPIFKSKPRKYDSQNISFGGLNLTDTARAGELISSFNLSSNRVPYMSPRQPRSAYGEFTSPIALYGWNGLVVVDGTRLYYNGKILGTVSDGQKQFATIGTKLVIFPDKKYLDLVDGEYKALDASATSAENDATFGTNYIAMGVDPVSDSGNSQFAYPVMPKVKVYLTLSWDSETGWSKTGETEINVSDFSEGDLIIPTRVTVSGALLIPTKIGDEPYSGEENEEGVYFEVTSAVNNDNAQYKWGKWSIAEYQVYSHSVVENGFLVPVYNTVPGKGSTFYGYVYGAPGAYPPNGYQGEYWYVSAGATGFTGLVDVNYDIKQSVGAESLLNYFKAGDIVTISGCTTYAENNKADLQIALVEEDKLTFAPGTFSAGAEASAVTVARIVPDFDFVCVKDNRLWGIEGQTIRCSSLGDPTNFNAFVGVSTDSYAVAVASEGNFTAIGAVSGELICFKENKIHKILGRYPAEYSMAEDDIEGVQDGGHKSLAIINNVLYYKGRTGIRAYVQGSSVLISAELGLAEHFNAVAGDDGVKYYVSMEDSAGNWGLFVYDTLKKIWHQEDGTHAADFAFQNGHLYYLDVESGEIIDATGNDNDESVEWSGELRFTENVLNRKYYSRLYIRAELDTDSYLKIETSIDGGAYKQAYITHAENKKTVTVPLLPTRCDELMIRLSGKGPCAVKAIDREFAVGSAL